VTDRESISYEQARDELAAVVRRLEAGGLTLEQSLDLWERGEKLAAVCAEWLDGARARLTTAMAARDAAVPSAGAGRAGPADGTGGEGGRGDTAKDGADVKDVPF
jgi:exodeoxyribonuclease VII small subunit